MDIQKEREAFDQYFKERYQDFYNEVFDENGDDRAIIGYSFAWQAWLAAKAVPVGFVLVEKKLINEAAECLDEFGMDSLADRLFEAAEVK